MTSTCLTETQQKQRIAAHTEVSRHRTGEGLVLWLRCTTCGRLRMVLAPDGPGKRPVVAGSATAGCTGCL